jgi:hypothetical protein
MKLSNMAIINRINTLNKYADTRLPQKISYAITRNLIIFQREYDCYSEELKKIINKYEDSMAKDEMGNIQHNENGFPVFSGDVPKEFTDDISTLLAIEVDVEPFFVPADLFDYDDSRYDSLTGREIVVLQEMLCNGQ